MTGEFNWESQTWQVGLSYRFGGVNNRALARKQRDSREAQDSGGFF
jgi:iron complex outermembrane receptor protein